MPTADDSPDGFVYDAADQLRHNLRTPLTTMSAHAQLLGRAIRRTSSLTDVERVKMLAGVTGIQTAVQRMCAVIDAVGD